MPSIHFATLLLTFPSTTPQVGDKLRTKGDELRKLLSSDARARIAALHDELAAAPPTCASDVDLSDRRIDQLAEHLEQQLFGAGAGEIGRTKLLAMALLERPAVQRLLQSHETRAQRDQKVAMKLIESAKATLAHLTTGKRGSRSAADHERFEVIVAALTPEDAYNERLISAMERLLGIHHEQIERGLVCMKHLPV